MCNEPFIHFKNIFYYVTSENIFRILNNSAYFQNIVVLNEPFKVRVTIENPAFSNLRCINEKSIAYCLFQLFTLFTMIFQTNLFEQNHFGDYYQHGLSAAFVTLVV